MMHGQQNVKSAVYWISFCDWKVRNLVNCTYSHWNLHVFCLFT